MAEIRAIFVAKEFKALLSVVTNSFLESDVRYPQGLHLAKDVQAGNAYLVYTDGKSIAYLAAVDCSQFNVAPATIVFSKEIKQVNLTQNDTKVLISVAVPQEIETKVRAKKRKFFCEPVKAGITTNAGLHEVGARVLFYPRKESILFSIMDRYGFLTDGRPITQFSPENLHFITKLMGNFKNEECFIYIPGENCPLVAFYPPRLMAVSMCLLPDRVYTGTMPAFLREMASRVNDVLEKPATTGSTERVAQ